jgi:hypothetical protein
MLEHIFCQRITSALARGQRRASRRRTWGPFRQRTIDRRYCGLPFIGGAAWFAQACRLAGGCPSGHCWQPGAAATPQAHPTAICHFCQSVIDEATSRCACFGHA